MFFGLNCENAMKNRFHEDSRVGQSWSLTFAHPKVSDLSDLSDPGSERVVECPRRLSSDQLDKGCLPNFCFDQAPGLD